MRERERRPIKNYEIYVLYVQMDTTRTAEKSRQRKRSVKNANITNFERREDATVKADTAES